MDDSQSNTESGNSTDSTPVGKARRNFNDKHTPKTKSIIDKVLRTCQGIENVVYILSLKCPATPEILGQMSWYRDLANTAISQLTNARSVLKPSDKAATGDSSAENSTNAPIRRQNSGSSAASNGSKSSQNSSVFSLSTDLERHAENVVKNLGEFQVRASQNAIFQKTDSMQKMDETAALNIRMLTELIAKLDQYLDDHEEMSTQQISAPKQTDSNLGQASGTGNTQLDMTNVWHGNNGSHVNNATPHSSQNDLPFAQGYSQQAEGANNVYATGSDANDPKLPSFQSLQNNFISAQDSADDQCYHNQYVYMGTQQPGGTVQDLDTSYLSHGKQN